MWTSLDEYRVSEYNKPGCGNIIKQVTINDFIKYCTKKNKHFTIIIVTQDTYMYVIGLHRNTWLQKLKQNGCNFSTTCVSKSYPFWNLCRMSSAFANSWEFEGIWNKCMYTAHHISFNIFVLPLVKLATIFTSYSTASNIKSPHENQIVTSDDYQVTPALTRTVTKKTSYYQSNVPSVSRSCSNLLI